MSAVSMNEAVKKIAQLENAKAARPPGGAPQEDHLPRKIFVCSPYRPISQDEKCRKDELEANIRRAKMACRILSFHTGLFATGTAPVFYTILKG